MKKFNEEIQITIEVDAIASQLRSMFKEDSANADVVVLLPTVTVCATASVPTFKAPVPDFKSKVEAPFFMASNISSINPLL